MKNFLKTLMIVSMIFNYYSFGQNRPNHHISYHEYVHYFYTQTTNLSDSQILTTIEDLEEKGISVEEQARQAVSYFLEVSKDNKNYSHFVRLEFLQIFYQSQFPELSDNEVDQLINEIDAQKAGRYVNSQIADGRVDSNMFRTALNTQMNGSYNADQPQAGSSGNLITSLIIILWFILCPIFAPPEKVEQCWGEKNQDPNK